MQQHLQPSIKTELARFTVRVECGADLDCPETEAIASCVVEGNRQEFRGLLIAALRLLQGKTQGELAEILGTSKRTVNRLESGNPFSFGLSDVETALDQPPGALKFRKKLN
jgi:DNA-binding XRE family transcriptional regulator